MTRSPLWLICAALVLGACSGNHPTPGTTGGAAGSGTTNTGATSGGSGGITSSGGSTSGAGPTFTADVQPIFAQHCDTCHVAGGIAPFPLLTYADAMNELPGIAADVASGTMPPWPPNDACNSYEYDRSLAVGEAATLLTWIDAGAPEGDPAIVPTPPSVPVGLSRVDLTLQMPEPYTPTLFPDDYHCFMLDWPETTQEYVTGFALTPGDPQIVHHAIAYIAPPDQLASYYAQEQSLPDGGYVPSYTCFGGPGGMGALVGWLGVWTPGSSYGDLPAGTGVPIQPGSKIILQVHYNNANGTGTDQSSIQLELASQVDKPAALIPFTDPYWLTMPNLMDIPAGQADVEHSFQADPGPDLNVISSGVLQEGQPFTIYSAGAHMHLRGWQETLSIVPASGAANECLLQVPSWHFRWQGNYFFQDPVVFNPGDQLSIDCHWNNSAANQPFVDGGQVAPSDLQWGEGTNDEMCLGMFYVTE